MGQRGRVVLTAVGLVILVGVSVWFWLIEPIRTHKEWTDRVRQDILSLAHKRPPDVSKGHWEFVIGWTINLHGNCGSMHSTVEPGWRDGFAEEFERRTAGPMTLADIEWIWDEYAAHTRYGKTYDRYRPTKSECFQNAQEGCFGFPVD